MLQGNPVNVRVQQDAQEFLQVFCDRIETALKVTSFKSLLKDSFVGKLSNQMLCIGGCNSVREQEEDFVTVSLQVASKNSMQESLEAFVDSEILQGVNCDVCMRKCDYDRRVVLKELKNTVIFHLKRFQLNWETFMNEKLNTRFEFPLEINLEPYT